MNIYNAKELEQALLSELETCNQFSFAVAWATDTNLLAQFLESDKLKNGIIGLNYYHTHPNVLEKCEEDDRIYFKLNKSSVFHPKMYIFKYDETVNVFIGSSNLTNGGMNTNDEITLKTQLNLSSEDYKKIENLLDEYQKNTILIDKDFINQYSKKYLYNLETEKLSNQLDDKNIEKLIQQQPNSFLQLTSNEYCHTINQIDWIAERISILEYSQNCFKEFGSIKNMPIRMVRAIAGIYGTKETNENFAWFGTLRSSGRVKGIFGEKSNEYNKGVVEKISDALDKISLTENVTKEDFESYVDLFIKAYTSVYDSENPNPIASITRLLAMKRPDLFFCLNEANKKSLLTQFRLAGTPNSKKYWEIIQKIRSANWQAQIENNIWQYRVAFIDAVFYEYSNH